MKFIRMGSFLLILFQIGCSHGSIFQNRFTASRNGELVDKDQHLEVVGVTGQFRGHGSGVLISNDIVLTAYHVTGPLAVSIDFGSHKINEDGEVGIRVIETIGKKVISAEPRKELVLLKLAEKVDGTSFPKLINKRLPPGAPLFSVGYGISPGDSRHNWKRKADLKLHRYSYVYPNVSLMASDSPKQDTIEMLEVEQGPNNSLPCVGDSGGPLYFKEEDGTLSVLGILSTVHVSDELLSGVKPKIKSHSERCDSVDLARFVPVNIYRSEILTGIDELDPAPFEIEDFSLKKGIGKSLSDSQRKLLEDLFKYAANIRGGEVSPLHRAFFESPNLNGRDYLKFIFDKIDFIGFDSEYSTGALAYLRGSSIFLTSSFFDASQRISKVELLSILMHEAHHTDSRYPSHVPCPDTLKDKNGNYLKSFYSGVQLAGRKACDTELESPYGINAIVAFNLAKLCNSCRETESSDLMGAGHRFLQRVINPVVRDQIISDINLD